MISEEEIKKVLEYYAEGEVLNEDGSKSELDSDYIEIEGDNVKKFRFKTGKVARIYLKKYFKGEENE